MARPTDYSPEILEKTKLYLSLCEDEEVQELTGLSAKGTELYRTKLKVNLPSIEGLSLFLGLSRETIYAWEGQEGKDEFSDIIMKVRAKQAKTLIEKGLSGDYNPTIAKLLLGKHGYSDKQELMGKDGEKLELGVVILPTKNDN